MGKTEISPRILVVNVHSTLNAGDMALLEMTLSQLRAVFPRAEFVVSANWPMEPTLKRLGVEILPSAWHLIGVATTPPRRQIIPVARALEYAMHYAGRASPHRAGGIPQEWERVLSAYDQSDMVVAVPGNQFFSNGRLGWPLFVVGLSIYFANFFAKPLYIMPQSIGPFRYPWERALVRRLYSPARLIFLRDSESMRVGREIGLPTSRVQFAPDPAFDYPASDRGKAVETLKEYGYSPETPSVGISLISSMPSFLNHGHMRAYYEAVARVIARATHELKMNVFIFDQVTGPTPQEDDSEAARYLVRQVQDTSGRLHHVAEPLSPAELKACYGCMDIFLASRLHAGLFAMAMGVPTVFVSYLSKTRGVLEALHLEDWMISLEEMDELLLWKKLQEAWAQRRERSVRLQEIMPGLRDQLHRVERAIAVDYALVQK